MVIDFHTHCFPDRIAAGALEKLSASAGALARLTDGTLEGTKRQLAQDGVDCAVALNIAVTPSQQRSVNDFAAAISSGAIIGFGSVHPFAPDALPELERMKELGIRGVKFHPHYQRFATDDLAVFPIYRKAASLGFITVFHAGHDLAFADSDVASPLAIARALPQFDGAPVVAAHMGGCLCWGDAGRHLAGLPVYFDTSFSHSHIPVPEALRLIEKHGVERILFGTDLPWSGITNELGFIQSLGLTEQETQQILGLNATKLLGVRLS